MESGLFLESGKVSVASWMLVTAEKLRALQLSVGALLNLGWSLRMLYFCFLSWLKFWWQKWGKAGKCTSPWPSCGVRDPEGKPCCDANQMWLKIDKTFLAWFVKIFLTFLTLSLKKKEEVGTSWVTWCLSLKHVLRLAARPTAVLGHVICPCSEPSAPVALVCLPRHHGSSTCIQAQVWY